MSTFTVQRDAFVTWLKTNPTFAVVLSVVMFLIGYIVSKV